VACRDCKLTVNVPSIPCVEEYNQGVILQTSLCLVLTVSALAQSPRNIVVTSASSFRVGVPPQGSIGAIFCTGLNISGTVQAARCPLAVEPRGSIGHCRRSSSAPVLGLRPERLPADQLSGSPGGCHSRILCPDNRDPEWRHGFDNGTSQLCVPTFAGRFLHAAELILWCLPACDRLLNDHTRQSRQGRRNSHRILDRP
jgi:hypothetical protein